MLTTYPLDNLVAEVHRLLGPTWALPPYNDLLPPYLATPSACMQQVDVDFLIQKGALDIPEPQIAQEIFKAYIRHIHPHIPVLGLGQFSNALFNNGSVGPYYSDDLNKISLLLFQAVMFAGAFFIDLKFLYAAGYLSRRHALDNLFQRARVRKVTNSLFDEQN